MSDNNTSVNVGQKCVLGVQFIGNDQAKIVVKNIPDEGNESVCINHKDIEDSTNIVDFNDKGSVEKGKKYISNTLNNISNSSFLPDFGLFKTQEKSNRTPQPALPYLPITNTSEQLSLPPSNTSTQLALSPSNTSNQQITVPPSNTSESISIPSTPSTPSTPRIPYGENVGRLVDFYSSRGNRGGKSMNKKMKIKKKTMKNIKNMKKPNKRI